MLKKFGLGGVQSDELVQNLIDRIMAGEKAQLSNGWTIEKVRVSNDERMELKSSYLSPQVIKRLTEQGAIMERIGYAERLFVPTNNAKVFEALTRGSNRPVVDFVAKPGVAFDAAESTTFVEPGTILSDAQSEADIEALRAAVEGSLRARPDNSGITVPVGAFRAVRLPNNPALSRVAAAFGKRIVGFHIPPEFLNKVGFFRGVDNVLPDVIFLRDDNNRPHLSTLGHELAHGLRRDAPGLYAELVQAVGPFVRSEVYRAKWGLNRGPAWANLSNDKMREEFIGDVLADGFLHTEFWQALGTKNPSLLERVFNALSVLIDRARRAFGSYSWRTKEYLTDFEAALRAAGEVVAKYPQLKGAKLDGIAFDVAAPRYVAERSGAEGAFPLWFVRDNKFDQYVDSLRRPRTFAIAVERSATQGHAKRCSYIFVYT